MLKTTLFYFFFSSFLFCVFAPNSAFAGYFERTIPNEIISPMDALAFQKAGAMNVGIIFPSQCPATALSPTVVLIAAHCMHKDNSYLKLQELKFKIFTKDGPQEADIVNAVVQINPPQLHSTWAEDMNYHTLDLAILILSNPIVGIRRIEVGVSDPETLKRQLVTTVGYPYIPSNASQMLLIDQCQITNVFHDSIYDSNCSFGQGSSGGPMFVVEGDKLTIAGIIIGRKLKNTPDDRQKYSADKATYSNMFFINDPFITKLKEFLAN